MSSTSTTREPSDDGLDSRQSSSLIRRSWHVMHDMFTPFSSTALASLPAPNRPVRYHRADAIPDAPSGDDGQRPTVRDYHAITSLPPQVRVPKKIPTSVKVEAKVWFANERTWVAWLNIAVIIGTLALALFNASKDKVATYFAYAYALISICVVVYAFFLYQYRITMIRRRDPGHFDAVTGPVVLGVALFVAVLLNFIIRVREFNRKVIPIPGPGLYSYTQNNSSPLSFHTQT
ncbi:Vacuolar transporter chaperone 2 [Hypsizygus marmoreus]|uniref:Vacuolar transporter chaperone 2 n=1 Tax=Hypsizygus marmoreus TaxID=39966 RepID=A0A369JXD1_HYPMA|nr:Vacuolar transporter chaperone 2 [Hypsizygus marmoreus]